MDYLDRYPWEKTSKETPKAYAAFLVYRNLPPSKRSVFEAWSLTTEKDVSKKQADARMPPGNWNDWCTTHNWVKRAEAWDIERDRIRGEIEIEFEKEAYREYRETLKETAIALIKNSVKISKALGIRLSEDGQVLPEFKDVLTIDKVSSANFKNASSIKIAQELWGGSIGVEQLTQYLESEGLLSDE